MKPITVAAYYRRGQDGSLDHVAAHVRMVSATEYEETVERRIAGTAKAIRDLRTKGGRPPYMVTTHMALGKIGLEYDQLVNHIIKRRKELGQDVETAIDAMARAMVMGLPKHDSMDPGQRRVWLRSGQHLVSLDPWWDSPYEKEAAAWVVTGYEIDAKRAAIEEEAKPVSIKRTVTK